MTQPFQYIPTKRVAAGETDEARQRLVPACQAAHPFCSRSHSLRVSHMGPIQLQEIYNNMGSTRTNSEHRLSLTHTLWPLLQMSFHLFLSWQTPARSSSRPWTNVTFLTSPDILFPSLVLPTFNYKSLLGLVHPTLQLFICISSANSEDRKNAFPISGSSLPSSVPGI